ncbi:hypothetical protein Q31a_07480 [Aureliella helgolandensis]|uniref:Uncharacterized protein n=1 Tax=Aureliella helgolandensis TaxID=2527968 RepID=A0A518G1J8_9BACT|nr:hypothetical protein Q31a_07480 [Aureliella helgolandensis]
MRMFNEEDWQSIKKRVFSSNPNPVWTTPNPTFQLQTNQASMSRSHLANTNSPHLLLLQPPALQRPPEFLVA